MIQVQPADASCGATIRGVDLSKPLDAATVAELRQIWLKHQVVAFADQDLSIEDLERFTLLIGPRGEDPYIAPIPGHKHVVEIKREANEQSKLFAPCSLARLAQPLQGLERRSSFNLDVERDIGYIFPSTSTDTCMGPPLLEITSNNSLRA